MRSPLQLALLALFLHGCAAQPEVPPVSATPTPLASKPAAKPRHAATHREKAVAFQKSGKSKQAMHEYKLALHENPKDPSLRYALALLLLAREKPEVLPARSATYAQFKLALRHGLGGEQGAYAESWMERADDRQREAQLKTRERAQRSQANRAANAQAAGLLSALSTQDASLENRAAKCDWGFVVQVDLAKTPDCPRDIDQYPIKKYVVTRAGLAEQLGKLNSPAGDRFLRQALANQDLIVVKGAYEFYIRKAVPGCEPVIIAALDKFGSSGMALACKECGNSQLAKAGDHWLYQHMYQVTYMPGGGSRSAQWGSQ